jgi:O-antigen ligase
MGEHAVWRPPWYVWPLLGLALLAAVEIQSPWLLQGYALFPVTVVVLGLVLLTAALWRLGPAAMTCAAIALTVFSGAWGALGIPGIPLERVVLAGSLLALLLRSSRAARVRQLRIEGVHLLLALTIAYVAASAAAAGTLTDEGGFLTLLDDVGAIPFLMLLLAPAIFPAARERNTLLVTLVALGAYLGVTAIFEALGPHELVFPHYIAVADSLTPYRQAGGPFAAPITEGFACFACAVAAAIACAQWRGWARRGAGAVVAVCALGAFLSLERAVWIAAAVAVAVVAVSSPGLRRRLPVAVLLSGLVIAGALLASPTLATHATARTNDQIPVWDRRNQTAAALRMIAAKPLFGFGWHTYAHTSSDYFRQAPNYPMTGFSSADNPLPLHDTYLSYGVELGLVGALLWLASLAWGLGRGILRRGSAALDPWKTGLLAVAVFYCVLAAFNPLQQPFTALLLWVWAGLVCASGDGEQATGQR